MAAAAVIETGAIIAGKLRVLRVIGVGGMGAVYEVEHTFTKHRRALKMLHPDTALSPTLVARFLREGSAAGRIGNPHIVETFDAGRLESGEPYLVMELLSGQSLSDLLEERLLSIREAIDVVLQACDGIQAAHDAGIVHRDLKPENLFIEQRDGMFVRVLDFGISKFSQEHSIGDSATVEGTVLGTPFYMSPEQVRGERDVDHLADVYALGVVLYECVTGRKPFVADTLPLLAVLIHQGKVAPVRSLRPDAPLELEPVIARALAVDKKERFASARELSAALRALSSDRTAPFDRTLPGSSTAVSFVPPPSAIPAGSARPSAASDPPSPAPPPAFTGRSRVVWAVAGVGGALLTLALVRERRPETASEPSAKSSASAVVIASTLERSPEIAPRVGDAAAEAPSAGKIGSSAPAASAARSSLPHARPSGSSVRRTRAAEHGLGADNPFAE